MSLVEEQAQDQVTSNVASDGDIPKNLGGRPKGSKDRNKRVSPYKKAEIKALYIAGHLPEEIVSKIKQASVYLIQRWAREEGWDVMRTQTLDRTSSGMLDNLLRTQEETFNGLQVIKEKSLGRIKKIDEKEHPVPTKYSEVVNAYIGAVDVEYKMKTNTLHARFIGEVANVLKKRIQDRELLSTILDDLVNVYEGYTQKSLPEPRKETENDN